MFKKIRMLLAGVVLFAVSANATIEEATTSLSSYLPMDDAKDTTFRDFYSKDWYNLNSVTVEAGRFGLGKSITDNVNVYAPYLWQADKATVNMWIDKDTLGDNSKVLSFNKDWSVAVKDGAIGFTTGNEDFYATPLTSLTPGYNMFSFVLDEKADKFGLGNKIYINGHRRNLYKSGFNEHDTTKQFFQSAYSMGPFGAPTHFNQTLAAGYYQSCAVMTDGRVKCWGYGAYGNVGSEYKASYLVPTYVEGVTGAIAVSTSYLTSCALLDSGKVQCWGYSSHGQTGKLALKDSTPSYIPGVNNAVQITSGRYSHCALTARGQVQCWGYGGNHQVYDNNSWTLENPVAKTIPDIGGATSVAGGYFNGCAVIAPGNVRCWGNLDYGQNGKGATSGYSDTYPAIWVDGVNNAVKISSKGRTKCVVLEDGRVKCWGYNYFGQAGDSSWGTYVTTPKVVPNVSGAVDVSVGWNHACALLKDDTVSCWGRNNYDQLGRYGDLGDFKKPGLSVIKDVKTVAVGGYHTCFGLKGGDIKCTGYGTHGERGTGDNTTTSYNTAPVYYQSVPQKSYPNVKEASVGRYHTCITDATTGAPRCFGYGYYGQLGVGTGSAYSVFNPVGYTPYNVGNTVVSMSDSVDAYGQCWIQADGDLYCSGYSPYGQFRSTTTVAYPKLIDRNVSSVSNGIYHGCYAKNDGTVWCIGYGGHGQLGVASTLNYSWPVMARLSSRAIDVSVGQFHSCAVLNNGSVQCWGNSQYYQTRGTTSTASATSPVTVPGVVGARQVSAGYYHTCALINNGKVSCWGYNGYGQARGQGNTPSNSTVTEVYGIADAVAVESGGYHTCALLRTGKVKCWGYGSLGSVGNGYRDSTNNISEVVGLENIKKINAGGYHTCAVDDKNQSWCWGYNRYGQLGEYPGSVFEYPNVADINGEWMSPEEDVTDVNLRECVFPKPGTIGTTGGSFTVSKSLCQVPGDPRFSYTRQNLTLEVDETASAVFSGWSNNSMSRQRNSNVHGMFARGAVSKTFLIEGHASKTVRIELDYYALDSWDGTGEYGYINVNGVRKWSKYRPSYINCSGWTSFNGQQGNDPWAGQNNQRCYSHIVLYATTDYLGRLSIAVGSTLNQAISDESFAFGNLKIYKVDYERVDVMSAEMQASEVSEVSDTSTTSIAPASEDAQAQAEAVPIPGSCSEIKTSNPDASSGEYEIEVSGTTLTVYCDMKSDEGGWTRIIAGKTPVGDTEAVFNGLFGDGTGRVVKYEIPSTGVSVYYKRKTPYSKNPYRDIISTWRQAENAIHSDFDLYSDWENLKGSSGEWEFCNYSDDTSESLEFLGFPRDCGEKEAVGGRWLVTDKTPYGGASQPFTSYNRPYNLYIKNLPLDVEPTPSSLNTMQEAEVLSLESNPMLVAAKPRNCRDVKAIVPDSLSGIYTIYPDGITGVDAYCNMTHNGGGWTMVWSTLRATAAAPTKYMTWNTATTAQTKLYGTITKNGLYYGGIPDGFETFTGLNWWNQLMLGTTGEFMYLWKFKNDGGYVNQGFTSNIAPFKSADNYTLRLSNYRRLYGATTSGVWSYHNNKPLSTYDRRNSYNSGCGTYYSYTPFWYYACWSGSINGGGENYGHGYYDGAYWTSSHKQWGTTSGYGAGAGYYFVRAKSVSPEVKKYLDDLNPPLRAEAKFKCGNVTKIVRASNAQTLNVTCGGGVVQWIRGTLYRGEKYLFYKDMRLKGINVDDVAVWRKELSEKEIAHLYGSGEDLKTTANAGSTCHVALRRGSTTSGTYFIKPNGQTPVDLTRCQMSIQDGGWTLVGKVGNLDWPHWSTKESLWTGATKFGRLLGRHDFKGDTWLNVKADDLLIVENDNPSQYIYAKDCLENRSMTKFFSDAFAASPFDKAGLHYYKSCGVFKTYSPNWADPGMTALTFAKNDWSDSYGVISTNAPDALEADIGIGSIDEDIGWGSGGARSDFGYGTTVSRDLWPQTLYIYVREPIKAECPATHPVDNGDGTCSSAKYVCPEGYTIDNGDGTCSKIDLVCPVGYTEYALDPSLCVRYDVSTTTSPAYLYCPNEGDQNGGETFDTDFTHTCAKDIASLTDDSKLVERTVLMETKPGVNSLISIEKMRNLSKDWTEPLRMVAFDGDKETLSYFHSAKLTFPYEKEVAKTRPFWRYSCESPATPTTDFKYRSDVDGYNSDFPVGHPQGQHPQACRLDTFKVCD